MKKWLSIYIYYRIDLIAFVLKEIEDYVKTEKIKRLKFFYIRYYDDHHHIRFRVLADTTLHESILADIKNRFKASSMVKSCKIVTQEYLPEVTRYGGTTGIKLAEDLFHSSSKCSFKLLFLNKDNSYPQIILRATLLNYITIKHLLPPEHRKPFLEDYTKLWFPDHYYSPRTSAEIFDIFRKRLGDDKPIVSKMTTLFDEGLLSLGSASRGLQAYEKSIKLLKTRLDKASAKIVNPLDMYSNCSFSQPINSIIASYIHMNNNRMGIKLIDEGYLSFLLFNATI
ncbi:thiopeptide-type bacteriocin biosynthesis protein [Pedobacter sp. JY14-1]|uniref:thiopeptide-type bacteriocin biosynthesis protein n=1 Tax=Pedobacter sp. JY14-1 TaxID=3034151 RepID=UPI0023E33782|nr:thiopeptide-type bacteriocin biosynthesis protein [Pedobacter sp. JY14-1]